MVDVSPRRPDSVTGNVLVTGASRGIGRAVAQQLAKAGFDVILWARTTAELESLAAECRDTGVTARIATVDVGDPASVQAAVTTSLADLGSLRGVVINAGGGIWNEITDVSPAEWRAVVGPNLDGAFHTLRVTLPLLRRSRHAQVVGIASDSSYYSYPGRAAYCASKAGFLSLMNTARREMRAHGIRVTSIVASRVDSYFRGKHPGARPEALSTDEIAEVVTGVFCGPPRVEVRELAVSALHTSFGPYPEHLTEDEDDE
ncbi:SDR family NAD(P)-dependent oxidoreductase [Micromonospora sp. NPDC051196]|uniref:SDR family NAD(P)-dependent oxidoreductase n=1 Tax=Micromonospora sp. NPDC051196 TaxID=3155281 RepID=UPI003432F2E2